MHKNEHIKALKINYKNLILGNCVHKKYWNGSEFVYYEIELTFTWSWV